MHALNDYPVGRALKIEHVLVAEQIFSVDARERHEIAFKLHRIERTVRIEHEAVDVVVVMVVMTFVEKGRIDVEHVVHVEARNVEHLFDRTLPHVDAANRRAGVHLAQTRFERTGFLLRHKVALGEKNPVGEPDLIARRRFRIKRGRTVLLVDDGHHAVETEIGRHRIVHEEGLCNGTGVGHAGRFNNDVVEHDFAAFPLVAKIGEHAREVAADRAAHASVVHRDNLLLVRLNDQLVVDVLGPEFVFDDRNSVLVIFRQNAIEERRLTRSEKARENRDRNVRFLHFFNLHHRCLRSNQGRTKRSSPFRYSPSGYVMRSG